VIWYLANKQPGVVKTSSPDAGGSVVKVTPPDAATVVKASPPDAATAQVIAKTTPDAPPKAIDPHVNNPPDRATKVFVQFDSTPPGAFVEVNGKNYGAAPVKVEVQKGQKNKITLRLRGYQTMSFTVDGSTQFVHKSLTLNELHTPDGLKPPEDDDGLATPKNH
jgi:hypothetical protein